MNRIANPQRLRSCLKLFHSPLAAHKHLAFIGRAGRHGMAPVKLHFRKTGPQTFPRLGDWKGVWDLVLRDPDRADLHVEGDLFQLSIDGTRCSLRIGSGDVKAFTEIHLRDVYGLRELPHELGHVIDLGAHIGMFSMAVAARAKQVVALEPVPSNFDCARKNLETTRLGDRVRLLQMALGPRTGERIELQSAGAHSSSSRGTTDRVEVECISLEDLFEKEAIDRCALLKCDIEGAEYAAFEAAPLSLLQRIDALRMEIHVEPPATTTAQFHALRAKLESAGLRVVHEPEHSASGALRTTLMLRGDR